MRIGIKRSVAKAICKRWGFPCVLKANPHHDARGRFATGGGGVIGGDSERGARDEQIVEFVEAAVKDGSTTKTLSVGKITEAAKARIKAKTGIEGVEQLVIDTSSVRHSLGNARHNLTKEDFLKIADVVNTSDDIELSDKKNRNNTTAVFLEKTNDKTTALQLVMEFRKNNENLALVTFYRQKKKRVAAPMPARASPKLTSKTAATHKQSIPQGKQNASGKSRFMVKKSVAKAICRQWGLPEVRKGNPHHDKLGRFADGAMTFTDEIKDEVIERIKNSTAKMRMVEYSRENYDRLFPEGKVETPIGKIRMSRHQFGRIGLKDNGKRKVLLGAIHQTLTEPDVIIKDVDSQGREAKLYIKSFLGGKAGKKIVFSVVPNINGVHVSVSNGLRKLKNAEDKIKRANIFYYKAEGGGSTTGTAENSDVAQQRKIISQVVKKSINLHPRLMLRKSVARRALRSPLPRLALTKSGRLVVRR